MTENNSTIVPNSSPNRWTEDRVDRLMLSLFAEQPVEAVQSVRSTQISGTRKTILVAVAAACLAVIVPALSARVDESTTDSVPLARWMGPRAVPTTSAMDLASADDTESMVSESDSSASESDETAEAPATPETEESAST